MKKQNILAIGYGGTTHLRALYAREKVADEWKGKRILQTRIRRYKSRNRQYDSMQLN